MAQLLGHARGVTDICAEADPASMQATRKALETLLRQVATVPRTRGIYQ